MDQIPTHPKPEEIAMDEQPLQIEAEEAPAQIANHHHAHHEKQPSWLKRKWLQLKEFIKECKRVLSVTKKPSAAEFKTIVKISGLGILLIGFIGFLIHFAREAMRYAGF